MKNFRHIMLAAAAAATALGADARNPYLPLWEFIPDGEPYVFEDPDNPGKMRVYIYGSHDNLIDQYCGRDQVVWSAPVDSLDRWRYDGIIFECKRDRDGNLLNPDGIGDVLYAPDVALKIGKGGEKTYYLYPNVQGERNNVVAKSSRPDGPFEVCNWSADDPRKGVGPFAFDPAAFVDDDGRAYGYWGFDHAYAAELDTATMATVKPGTEIVDMVPGRNEDRTFRFYEASSIRKIKDKYVFVYSRWTNPGECGLPGSNYTLAYAYSNTPLGPWTYGGTIIDGRGIERRPDGTNAVTATPNGNTHGSICEINGKWWVFYHRQAGTDEYGRQAMVAPIDVEVIEGPDGYVRIGQAEFTSEGFETGGLDPLRYTPAGIACYFTGPAPAYQKYPKVVYPGSHIENLRIEYDGKTAPYSPAIDRSYMVNNTPGSTVGYKYFDLSKTYGTDGRRIAVDYAPEAGGTMEIWLDRPNRAEGGVKLGELKIPAETEAALPDLGKYNGKHALFFVFTDGTEGASVATLKGFEIK